MTTPYRAGALVAGLFLCLALVSGASAAPGDPSLTLSPSQASIYVWGGTHTLTATLLDAAGAPIPGIVVTFTVTYGPNAQSGTATTSAAGVATWSYQGNAEGLDREIVATATVGSLALRSNSGYALWIFDAPPSFTLSSRGGGLRGGSNELMATLLNRGSPMSGVVVTFTVTGANPRSGTATTNAQGIATWSYRGAYEGVDWAVATATIGSRVLRSETVNAVWFFDPAPRITLAPASASLTAPGSHELTATLVNYLGGPLPGVSVTFTVTGANSATGTATTDANGVATWRYTGAKAGSDTVVATATAALQAVTSNAAGVTWKEAAPINRAPDTSKARASIACLWPANHGFVAGTVLGVTDPDGDRVRILVTRITSDEPTATARGAGGALFAPDASGVGASVFRLRAERSGALDGRVYAVSFTASDGTAGGTSTGRVFVKVPLAPAPWGKPCTAVDSGQRYDATKRN